MKIISLVPLLILATVQIAGAAPLVPHAKSIFPVSRNYVPLATPIVNVGMQCSTSCVGVGPGRTCYTDCH